MEEVGEKLIDITLPIQKPQSFDELCALTNHYEDMENIIDNLSKCSNSCIIVDSDNNDEEAESFKLDSEYSVLFIRTLEEKMKEIRNVLNFN